MSVVTYGLGAAGDNILGSIATYGYGDELFVSLPSIVTGSFIFIVLFEDRVVVIPPEFVI